MSTSPLDLSLLDDVAIDARTKGFPAPARPLPLRDVAGMGWTLDDLVPPVLLLREEALDHNLELMAAYCRRAGVSLAPHGKTTMAPALWQRQLLAGAWAITAANAVQARIMAACGVRRVLVANQITDPGAISWLAEALADPGLELLCYVDSEEGVDLLDRGLQASPRPLRVLLELGYEGGRTGCRDVAGARLVARRVSASSRLRLAGVAGFEGLMCHRRATDCPDRVRAFLDRLRELAESLTAAGAFDGVDEVIVTAGGSAFFDLVVERLEGGWQAPTRLVLRSGCYLTHDSGLYKEISPFGGVGGGRERLRPALEAWAAVLSRPEPRLSLLGMGRRDVPHDAGLPVARLTRPRGGPSVPLRGGEIVRLDDQHGYLTGSGVPVGDLVGCGVSHPCTAFDKWRVIPVLDAADRVVDAVATCF